MVDDVDVEPVDVSVSLAPLDDDDDDDDDAVPSVVVDALVVDAEV